MIAKHSYSGNTFDSFFDNFKPEEKKTSSQFVKVAGGCISCPLTGNVSASACNACKFASGFAVKDGTSFIKCSYVSENMVKEASSVQGVHWENKSFATLDDYLHVKEEITNKFTEELKWAAREIGVKLAQSHIDDFSKQANSDGLKGKGLQRAARSYVAKLREAIAPAERRQHTGTLDNVFSMVSKNSKTIVANVSAEGGDNNSAGCGYLGSKVNPNTLWEPDAIVKAAQTPSNDEIIKKNKQEVLDARQKIKESYWEALQQKLADKTLVSNARVHGTHTVAKQEFNSKLPQNAMSIFGENEDFVNLPEKTAGEQLAEQKMEKVAQREAEKKQVEIKPAQNLESKNWLFS